MLVDALCERWGWTVPDGWCGKAVWAELGDLLQPMQHSAVSGKGLNSPDVDVLGS